jgi:hypothetical protein
VDALNNPPLPPPFPSYNPDLDPGRLIGVTLASLKLEGGNLGCLIARLPVPLALAPPVAALTLRIINILSGVCALLAFVLNGLAVLCIPIFVGLSAPDLSPANPYPICDMDEAARFLPGVVALRCTLGTGIIDRLGGRGG